MATASVTNTFVAGTAAEAPEVNTNFTNLVTFLNNSVVHRDGSKALTANLDAGSNKIVNLTAGTAGTDAVNLGQVTGATSPLPLGVMGSASIAADQDGISAEADVESLTVTWTAEAGRVYRTTAFLGSCQQAASSGTITASIADGSNTTLASARESVVTAGDRTNFTVSALESGLSAGSTTRKVRILTSAGTVSVQATSATPAYIVVEDLGLA